MSVSDGRIDQELVELDVISDDRVLCSNRPCGTKIREMMCPGTRPSAVKLRHELQFAEPGCCLLEGPEEPFSLNWVMSIRGLEGIQFYLWLVKDWSWSQDNWVYPGIIFGILSLVYMTFLFFITLYVRLYSDSWLLIGMILWLFGNFWWMVAEFWSTFFIQDPVEAAAFFESHLHQAKIVSALAVIWQAVYYLILRPMNIPRDDRRHPILTNLTNKLPRPRFQFFFRDFREYENLHLLLWTFKDCMWIYDYYPAYVIAFIPTILLGLDIMYIYATHKRCFVDTMHSFFAVIWVLANFVWATGEIVYENPAERDGRLTPQVEAYYSWPSLPPSPLMIPRYIVGWMFLFEALAIVMFYALWFYLTYYGKIEPLTGPSVAIAFVRRNGTNSGDDTAEDGIEFTEHEFGTSSNAVRRKTHSSERVEHVLYVDPISQEL